MSLGHSISDFVTAGKGSGSLFGGYKRESTINVPRLVFLRLFLVGGFLLLLSALVKVQIFQGDYFHSLADENRIREIPIHAARGIIYDRNGVALVSNLPAFRLRQCRGDSNCEVDMISKDQAIAIETAGLTADETLEVDSSRHYNYGQAFAHVLGYVSQVSKEELAVNPSYSLGQKIGRGGVEEAYESVLAGVDGKELVEVDASGQKIRTVATIEPIPGRNLTLTLDASVQNEAFKQISGLNLPGGKQAAAAVATDPNSGAVLALASSPSFDPNVFTDLSLDPSYRSEKIKEIFADSTQPLFNRAISGTYPAGSTFKIVTATAGLETGKITENTTIDDPGILIIGPYKFPNWKFLRDGGTQGTLNVVSALQKSNDIFFYRVGEWVGVDDLASWALKFGLDNKLGIDLPGEASGSFPTKQWRDKFTNSWYLGDTYHLAIGQGDLLVTPLQVNRWTSVVASGGRICVPHVLVPDKGEKIWDKRREIGGGCKESGISSKTIDLVRQGLVAACSPGGTAWPLFNFKVESRNEKGEMINNNIQLACKTGTAEFGDPNNRTHAWLTSYAPSEKPSIVVTVIVEGGGEGDTVAAPIVKKILEAWLSR